jgi:hypothetical protein
MTFKSLATGDEFRFSSERTMPYSGMMKGPWIKTGTRSYVHVDNPDGTKYRVGSTSAKVDFSGYSHPVGSRFRNPGTWFKLDHPHAIAVVDDEVKLISSKPLTNPQRKKFKAFVSKLRKALK